MLDKKIFIGCSSSNLINKEYMDLASSISLELVSKGYDLVFGAASFGMMGKCYDAFSSNNKKIYSYTTSKYESDLLNLNSYKDSVCSSSFDRTSSIYKESDILLFLPGGTGTIAEIFSMLEENRSISCPKKIILYNYNGYYDEIINIIKSCVNKNFNTEDIFSYIDVCNSTSDVIKKIDSRKL